MAVLVLSKLWVNRLDTGEAVSAYSQDRAEAHTSDGEVRGYAGGRQRSITREGEAGQFTFTLRRVPLADVETLRTWKGLTVQVRDNRGRKFFGVYFGVPIVKEYRDNLDLYDVTIELRTVTVSEGV